MKKKKITIFMYSLGGGGVQRFVMNLLSKLSYNKYEITIALVNRKGTYLNQLPNYVKIVDLKSKRVHFSLIPLIKHLRKDKPDILFSIDTSINLMAILAKKISKYKGKLIIRQAVEFNKYSTSKVKLFLARHLYPKVDKCIVLSNTMKENLSDTIGLSKKKMKVIYNSIDVNYILEKRSESIDKAIYNIDSPKIIAVGRLTKQKNFAMLLDAFEIVLQHTNATLIILGEGEEENFLKEKAKDLMIENRIIMLGFKNNPYKYIYNSDIFVLSSLYEGLSNALLEALACKVPIVTTNNPDKIIQNGINGYQADLSKKSIADYLIYLLDNEFIRQKIVQNNNKYANQFDIHVMVKKYEEIFDTI